MQFCISQKGRIMIDIGIEMGKGGYWGHGFPLPDRSLCCIPIMNYDRTG